MDVSSLLSELGAEINIKDLALDETSRTCRLVFGDDTNVDIEVLPDGGTLFLHGVVGHVPKGAPSSVFVSLLKANLFGYETGPASLGFDPQQEEVLLFQRLDLASTDYVAFRAALERFVGTLMQWRKRAAAGLDQPAAPATASSEPGDFSRFNAIQG